LVNAYGSPIKMSFSVSTEETKLYIYLFVVDDFGVSSDAKIAKY
jgi:hypothetical protein